MQENLSQTETELDEKKSPSNRITKILSGVIILTSVVVMFGWFFNIPILTSILPQWVTMKFTTALSFLLVGLIIYVIAVS